MLSRVKFGVGQAIHRQHCSLLDCLRVLDQNKHRIGGWVRDEAILDRNVVRTTVRP